MERAIYFEDFVVGAVRTTHGRTITETDFVVHAGHSGDFYPHHLDAEFMKTQPFGQRIAHGTMTFTIGVGLTAGEINPVAFTYGYERLRFPKPVFIGDTIKTRLTIDRKEDDPKRPSHGKVIEKLEVINQRGECVLACEHVLLVERRKVGSGQ
ncbi:MAG: MaoC/PaaZ C-terminal domain-containing protein [Tepidisphaeraceae bacterium]